MPPADKKQTKEAKVAGDIDDIFAGPSKRKEKRAGEEGVAGSKASKRSKKSNIEETAEDKSAKGKSTKGKSTTDKSTTKDKSKKEEKTKSKDTANPAPPPVLEVVDPSVAVRAAVEKTKAQAKAKGRGKEVEADMAFRDSRGDGNRECIWSH